MGKVVQMLEGIIEIEKPPAPKAGTEECIGESSGNVSSKVVAVPHSSSSLLEKTGCSSFVSGRTVEKSSSLSARNVEIASACLLQSET